MKAIFYGVMLCLGVALVALATLEEDPSGPAQEASLDGDDGARPSEKRTSSRGAGTSGDTAPEGRERRSAGAGAKERSTGTRAHARDEGNLREAMAAGLLSRLSGDAPNIVGAAPQVAHPTGPGGAPSEAQGGTTPSSFAELESRWASEEVDPDWTHNSSALADSLLASAGLPPNLVREVQCKQSVCRVDLEEDTTVLDLLAVKNELDESEIPVRAKIEIGTDALPRVRTAYVAREGAEQEVLGVDSTGPSQITDPAEIPELAAQATGEGDMPVLEDGPSAGDGGAPSPSP